jgi:hypothetical protein
MHDTSQPEYNHKFLAYMVVNNLCQSQTYNNRISAGIMLPIRDVHFHFFGICTSMPQLWMHTTTGVYTLHLCWPHLHRHSAETSIFMQLISASQQINYKEFNNVGQQKGGWFQSLVWFISMECSLIFITT